MQNRNVCGAVGFSKEMEMVTMYRARNYYRAEIKAVEIDRKTESSVWIKGQRNGILTDGQFYADSFEAAKEWICTEKRIELQYAQKKLDDATQRLAEAEALQP